MKSVALAAVLMVAWGCSGSSSPRPASAPAPAAGAAAAPGAASEVPVTVDATALPAERRAAFDKLGGDARLAAAVREEMRRTGRHPSPPGAQLQLVVTAFRLR